MPDRILYFISQEDGLSQPLFGELTLGAERLEFRGDQDLSLAIPEIRAATLFRRNGLATTIRLQTEGETVSFSVLRFRLGKAFFLPNLPRTQELFQELREKVANAAEVETASKAGGRPQPGPPAPPGSPEQGEPAP